MVIVPARLQKYSVGPSFTYRKVLARGTPLEETVASVSVRCPLRYSTISGGTSTGAPGALIPVSFVLFGVPASYFIRRLGSGGDELLAQSGGTDLHAILIANEGMDVDDESERP